MLSNELRPPQLTKANAAAFQLQGVVDAYHLRTPYPDALAACLLDLSAPRGGPVLEIGCGTGEIARAIAPHVERVDAIDISAPMLAKARSMSGGDHPAIRWTESAAETVALQGPYALAVIGDALHWMDWDVVLGRVAEQLAPGARIALVSAVAATLPWAEALTEIIARYSVMQDFRPYDFIGLLVQEGSFNVERDVTVGDEPFTRSVDEYVESLHATAGFPRERMGADAARAFDDEVGALVKQHVGPGSLVMSASARVVSGLPPRSQ